MGRIGIFIGDYPLGYSPSLINVAEALAGEGFEVEFFPKGAYVGGLKFRNGNIRVLPLDAPREPGGKKDGKGLKGILPLGLRRRLGESAGAGMFGKFLDGPRSYAFECAYLERITKDAERAGDLMYGKSYDCLIGADPDGLATASLAARKGGIPVVYYSLELYLSTETRDLNRQVQKKYERIFNRDAAFTVIQDGERARALAEDNGIDIEKMVLLPVCADGPPVREKTDLLRMRLNIPDGARIVLYAGFLGDWAECESLARAVSSWPEGVVLVLHSNGEPDRDYLERLKRYEGERMRLSLEPVPYEDLDCLLASADAGIALYKDMGKNFTLISSASGKLAHYLKCGLPVIVNSFPSMKKVVEGGACGVCVEGPEGVASALERIFADYARMREGAFRCYEENYRFSKRVGPVIERIKGLSVR